jgi:hypothetical protein
VGAVRQPTPQPIVFKVLGDFLRDHDCTDQEKKVYPKSFGSCHPQTAFFKTHWSLWAIYLYTLAQDFCPVLAFLFHSIFCSMVIPRFSNSAKKISGSITLSGGSTPLASMSPRAIICAPMLNGMAIFL